MFAHLFETNFPHTPVKQVKGLVHFQAPVKTAENEDLYFEEEENRRVSLKEHSKDNIYTSFIYDVLPGHFFERLKSESSFYKYFSRFSTYGSPEAEFCVLRL